MSATSVEQYSGQLTSDGSILTPFTIQGENGEIQHAVLQYVHDQAPGAEVHQTVLSPQGPQAQVVMLPSYMFGADGQLQLDDGVDTSQIQLLTDQGTAIELDPSALQQFSSDQLVQLEDGSVGIALSQAMEQQMFQQTQQEQSFQEPDVGLPEQQMPVARRRTEPEVKPPVGKGPWRCEKCDQEFVKWRRYEKHLQNHDENDKPHRCPHCAESYNFAENLHLHMSLHNPSNPTCPECGKKFSRIAGLKAHLLVHEREENLPCPECLDEFPTQQLLRRHLESHQREYTSKVYPCKKCDLEFFRLQDFREHTKEHVKIKTSLRHKNYKRNIDRSQFTHRCKHCEKSFQKPSQLERHIRIHTGDRPFKCDVCSKAFNQKGAMMIHKLKHTGIKSYQCEFCSKGFSQKGNLRAHIKRVHTLPVTDGMAPSGFKCKECTCVFKKLGSLNAHISREHSLTQELLLSLDDMMAQIEENGDQEIVMHAGIEDDEGGGEEMQAKEEQEVMKGEEEEEGETTQEVQEEEEKENSTEAEELGAATASNQGDHSVDETFQKNSSVTVVLNPEPAAHDGRQTTGKQLQVAEVNSSDTDIIKEAWESSEGNQRPRMRHQSDAPGVARGTIAVDKISPAVAMSLLSRLPPNKRQCVIATMQILDPASGQMKRHIIRRVNGVRLHQCTYCTKEFKKPSDLIRHVRIHTNEKPYKCGQCFRTFAVKSTLTAHIKMHSGVKECRCTICDKMFATQGSLKVHTRLHTGSKPFSCSHCDKKFRTTGHRKAHLATHLRERDGQAPTHNHHRRVGRPTRPEVNLPDVALQEPILITDEGDLIQAPSRTLSNAYITEFSIERPYRCGHCSRGFKKSSHLKQHVQSHTGEKPYKCLQCFKSFVSSGVLKAHIRTHTGIKAYKCVDCDMTFSTKGSMKRHISVHTENRPYMCPYCQRTFKRSVYCKKHIRVHKQEIAMNSIQESSQTLSQPPETEVTIATEEIPQSELSGAEGVSADEGKELAINPEEVGVMEQQGGAQQYILTDSGQVLSVGPVGDGQSLLTEEQLQNAFAQQMFNQSLLMPEYQNGNGQQHMEQMGGEGQAGEEQHVMDVMQQLVHNDMPTNMPQVGLNFPITVVESSSAGAEQYTAYLQQSTDVEAHTENNTELLAEAPPTTDPSSLPPLLRFRMSPRHVIEEETVEERRTFPCNQCRRTFPRKNLLQQHLKLHPPAKTHSCPQCTAVFSTESRLVRHQLTEGHGHIQKLAQPSDQTQQLLHQQPAVPIQQLQPQMTFHQQLPQLQNELPQSAIHTIHLQQQAQQVQHLQELPAQQVYQSAAQVLDSPAGDQIVLRQEMLDGEGEVEEGMEGREQQQQENKPPQMGDSSTWGSPPDTSYQTRNARRARMHRTTNVYTIPEEQAEELAKTHTSEDMPLSEKVLIESAMERSRISEVTGPLTDTTIIPKHPNICPHCPKSFKKPSDLTRHVRIHTGEKPYSCHLCTRSFTVKSTLDSHMKTHASSMKLFNCHICHSSFSTKGSMKVHMRLHTGARPFKCPLCTQKFRTSGHRKSHMAQHNRSSHAPSIPLKKRRKSGEERILPASKRNKVPSVRQLAEAALPPEPQPEPPTLTSAESANNLDQLNLLSFNLNENIGSISVQPLEGVPIPSGSFQLTGVDANSLAQALQIDPGLLHQLQQGTTLTINATGQQQVNELAAAQQHFVTGEDTSDLDQLEQSYGLNDLEADTEEAVVDPLGLDSEAGILEEGASEDASQLDDSMLGADPDQSDQGGPGVSVSGMLAPKFACQACNRLFRRLTSLREHERLQHPDLVPAMSSSPGKKALVHSCYMCDKTFKKPSQLERHVRIHTGERPFICQACGKAFNQKNALVVHSKKHTGDKPYQCPHCSQAYIQKCNLKTHLQRYHAEVAESTPIIAATATPQGVTMPVTATRPSVQMQQGAVTRAILIDLNDLGSLGRGLQLGRQTLPVTMQLPEPQDGGGAIDINKLMS